MKKKNKVKINTTTNLEVTRVIKITIGVIIVLLLTYLVAGLITGDISFKKDTKTNEEVTKIQYEEIIAGRTFNQNSDEYYVMYFNFTDSSASSYISLKDIYENKDNALPFYIVDLEKGFNKDFVASENEDYNKYPTNTDELKVTHPTILKIANHKVTERIEGSKEVLDYLTEINK